MSADLPVLCIGSALWDIIASSSVRLKMGNDVPGLIRRRPGGVAGNIALALAAAGTRVALLTVIGRGAQGDALIAKLEAAGIDCSYVTRTDDPTDSYLAIENPDGEVFAAIADCASLEKAGETVLDPLRDGRLASEGSPWRGSVVIDGNLPVAVLDSIANHHDMALADLHFVPASPGKAGRMRAALRASHGTLFVNKGEAEILCRKDFPDAATAARAMLQLGASRAVVTDGPAPAALADATGIITKTPPTVDTKSTTGAGDTFLAGFIAAELAGLSPTDTLAAAIQAAADHICKEVT